MKIPDFVKQNSKFLIAVIILTVVPVISYLFNFHGKISDEQGTWGTFGDFIGGTLNTILTFILIIYTIYSFHESQRLAQKISEETNKLSKQVHLENIDHNKKLHIESLDLQKKQVTPYPSLYISSSSEGNFTNIEQHLLLRIDNQGVGLLIIKEIKFIYNGIEANNIDKHLEDVIKTYNSFFHRKLTNKFVIPVNSGIELVEIGCPKNVAPFTKESLSNCIKEVGKRITKMQYVINYTDIYENSYPIFSRRLINKASD